MDTSGDRTSDDDAKADTETDGNADTGTDTKGSDGESTTTDTDDGTKVDDATADKQYEYSEEESVLRAQLRAQAKKTALIEAKLDTLARQQKANAEAEEANEDAKQVEPSSLEAHQAKLNDIAQNRGDVIADMLELMLINPKYEDVESVCSKTNLDETIETLARAQVSKEGGDLVETMMAMEVDIWSQRNPYSYMYGLIKDVHPRYKVAESTKTGDKQDTSDGGKQTKAPAKAPLSAADLSRGGGGKNLGEWTADKIDNLAEEELNSVPADVYDKYLRGDLDK